MPMFLDAADEAPALAPSQRGADRLLHAAVEQISDGGLAAASARAIAGIAGVAPSAINYNYGGLEHLLSTAFADGVGRTRAWLQPMDAAVAALPATPAGAGLALAYVIEAWTGAGRSLALLYQEALTAAEGQTAAQDWTRLWRDYWVAAAERFGLSETDGQLMHLMFESEALYHLSRWSPALEGAALRELCSQFAALLLRAPEPTIAGAADLAARTAGVLPHGVLSPAAARIAEAAAAVVHDVGLGRLTHRAVAARAGATTGAVTHHFRTIDQLIAGAVRGQVLAMARESGDPATTLTTVEKLFSTVRLHVSQEGPSARHIRRTQLFLPTVRRADLAQAGAVIRFANGATLVRSLTPLFDIPEDRRLLCAGVLSRLFGALGHARAADPRPAATEALLSEIEARLASGLYAR